MERSTKRTTMTAVAALACAGLVACAKGGSAPGTGPAGESDGSGGAANPRGNGHDLPVAIRSEGCPDVADFFSRLLTLPGDSWVRRHTVSFKPAPQNEDGSRPRANFLSLLAFSSFELLEKRLDDFRTELGSVEQSGCRTVRFIEPETGALEFVVRAATPNSIQLGLPADPSDPSSDPSKDTMTKTLEWSSPRELRVHTSYPVMDMCPDYKSIRVERTQSLQWGPEDLVADAVTADVDPAYVARATKPLSIVPGGLASFGAGEETEEGAATMQTAAINVSELRRLRDSQVRTDMKVCPYRSKPPTGEEPPPPDIDTPPTPTPAPDTGAAPIPEAPPEAPTGG